MAKTDKYKPTHAEAKLLKELLDPNNLELNVSDTCAKAGVNRNVYYEATKKPGFNNLIKDLTLELLKSRVSKIIETSYKVAKTEKGYNDRKLLLTMANIYSDKVESLNTNHNLNDDVTELTDEELDEKIKNLQS